MAERLTVEVTAGWLAEVLTVDVDDPDVETWTGEVFGLVPAHTLVLANAKVTVITAQREGQTANGTIDEERGRLVLRGLSAFR